MLQSDLLVPKSIAEGIERASRHITADGTTLSGSERAEIANTARAAANSEHTNISGTPIQSVARKMATQPHALTAADVASVGDPSIYVETLSVVARTMAIDTTARGIGATNVPLIAAAAQRTRGRIDPAAKQRSALVPTVGAAGPTSALSLLPSEDAAQEDLHGALYLSYAEMGDLTIHKGLPRWQLELMAARTSMINHCFF